MRFNTKIRYGIRTMIEIAMNEGEEGILQKQISKKQNISNKYLDQIIASLKASGLIANAGGKKSGYILAKASKDITTYDIYSAFEIVIAKTTEKLNEKECPDGLNCAAKEYWDGLNNHIVTYMKSVRLFDLIVRQRQIVNELQGNMYYI